jgi:hypothetical protein
MMPMPDLTDDEIKKYGTEVLKDLDLKGLKNGDLKELLAAIGFCHLIATTAQLHRLKMKHSL